MKNTINYYFNMIPRSIHKINNYYFYYYNGNKYYLVPFNRSVDDVRILYELNEKLIYKVPLVHEIILNKDKSPITYANNVPYILLKVYANETLKATLFDIENMQVMLNNSALSRNNWFDLWTKKIDYIEYQINEVGKDLLLIRESLSYHIGLAETAISYVKNINIDKKDYIVPLVLSHKRVDNNMTLFDLYNPLNFIIDHRSRDVSEYIKSCFFNDINVWEEMHKYFTVNKYSAHDFMLFFARMLYPSYYFDLYEKIIKKEIPEEDISKIIKRIEKYEEFLGDLYNYICQSYVIPPVEWITDN